MKFSAQLLIAGLGLVLLAGCPSAPDPLQGDTEAEGAIGSDQGGSASSPGESGSGQDIPDDIADLLDDPVSTSDPSVGACCLGTSCVEIAPERCAELNGRFLGSGQRCVEQLCAVAALLVDSDRDGCIDLYELLAGTDPQQPGDCADIDGDGVPNEDDPDVDGDGIPNAEDDDIDGDEIPNGADRDADGDGKTKHDDPDEDGDGLSDRWDLDDDNDGEPDDEDDDDDNDDDDDDDDDEPEADALLDLIERLRTGEITEQDRNAIANEIVKRLDSFEDKARVQAILVDIVQEAMRNGRQLPPTTVPAGVDAIDTVYEQLAEAIELARSRQSRPKDPLDPKLFPEVLRDFMARAASVANLAKAFPSLSIDELGTAVSDLRRTFDPAKLEDLSELLGAFVDPHASGNAGAERDELTALTRGASSLGRAFGDAEALDLLNAASRLRDRADQLQGTDDEKEEKYQSLLDRMSEIAEDTPNITDALEQVEAEDDADDDDSDDDDSDDDDSDDDDSDDDDSDNEDGSDDEMDNTG